MQEQDPSFRCSLSYYPNPNELKQNIIKSFEPGQTEHPNWSHLTVYRTFRGSLIDDSNTDVSALKFIKGCRQGFFVSNLCGEYSLWACSGRDAFQVFNTRKDKIKNYQLEPDGTVLVICEKETYLLK